MTVKDLKAEIENLPDDMEVIIQKDGEGNNYSPLCGVNGEDFVYVPETAWYGEVYDTTWSSDDAGMDDYDWECICNDNHKCLILRPVH